MGVYEDIDESAIDRIFDTIDTDGDYHDIRKRLVKRYPGWSAHQRDRFSAEIAKRRAFQEMDYADMTSKQQRAVTIERQTTFAGKAGHRRVQVRNIRGHYAGMPENLKIYSRHGNVYYRNLRTGKKGRLS